jgi:hypothetical protein
LAVFVQEDILKINDFGESFNIDFMFNNALLAQVRVCVGRVVDECSQKKCRPVPLPPSFSSPQ